MTTVVQRSYRPQIAPGLPGMVSEMVKWDAITRQVETAAGIGFGLAVSQGVGDRGCILGGSSFLGILIRDITGNRISSDPLFTGNELTIPVDTIPQYRNAAILTRGHIWVEAHGGGEKGVIAADPLFYSATTGQFTNSGSGAAAYGYTEFSGQPVDGQTITLNGSVWTFKNSGAAGLQVNIGPTLGDTVAALAAALEASADVNTDALTYWAWPPSPGGAREGSGAYQLRYAAEAVGTAGNALVVSTNVPGATVSGAGGALAGGTAAATAVVGAYWLDSVGAGEVSRVSLGIQR